jgi:protein-serine/threonine kinase
VDWWSLGLLIYEMLSGSHPFKSKRKNKKQIFNQITDEPVSMLPGFSEEAADLLTGLLKIDPSERLGSSEDDAEEIKSHKFFEKVDWKKVYSKQQAPPYKP